MLKISDVKLNIPKYPGIIIDTLKKAGYDAYIVGGCVRDELLEKTPSDFDITTNAKPEIVKSLFKRTIDTGIKHGTVSVLFYENDKPLTYEVTTYRIDGEYDDARHPKNVTFVEDLKEDLLRRDFTVNAMAYNDDSGLVDEFGGLIDLEKKIIRAVGNPIDRFTEDALRLLRAIRFAAKLTFTIDEDTMAAIPKLAPNLLNVSKERIQVELTKTLISDSPEFIEFVFSLGLAPYICKNFELVRSGKIKGGLSVHLAYACLFYNTSIVIVSQILKDLKFDNSNTSKILALLDAKRYFEKFRNSINKREFAESGVIVKELINYLKYDLTYDFIEMISINAESMSDLTIIESIKERVDDYKVNNVPISLKDLDLTGNDVIDAGFSGEEVGVALTECLKIVHKNRQYNDKKQLQEILRNVYNIYRSNGMQGGKHEL